MGTFNFNGNVTAGAIGDNATVNVGRQDTAAETLRLAADLARWLRDEGASREQIAAAETLRGELDRAAQERRAAEPGVVQRSLEIITLGLGAGSGGLALAQEISRLLTG
ncbi:hypothetical protein ABZZ20_06795 [Streptomyces sp. NPDC006430]|uniref:hypothetical protein n=1 Tax=Streptomyces sp. NPDC006430 TaxID=3154299 RepID=UPI0033A5DC97